MSLPGRPQGDFPPAGTARSAKGSPVSDAEPLLKVENLGVRFPRADGELRALDGVSLALPRSQTLAIVGESGSGKSVLSRAILRILPGTARVMPGSRIVFDGLDLLAQSNRQLQRIRGRRIAMVFQDPMTALNPVRSIGSQLVEGLRLHLGLSAAQASTRAVDLLAQVGIGAPQRRLVQYPHELSGGMRQRVVIAMAIACEPELLIADEPTTALDVTVQAEILDLLKRLQQERRMTMILVTHDLGVAAGQADHIAVMYAGQIVEQAPVRELFRQPRMPYTGALLRAMPRLTDAPHAVLASIPGRPLTVTGDIPGCRYAPRCERAEAQCLQCAPPLAPGADTGLPQQWRCWKPLERAA